MTGTVFRAHTLVDGAALCGGVAQRLPAPPFTVEVCEACVAAMTRDGHMAKELTMRWHLDQARAWYRSYLDRLGPAARAANREQLLSVAAATLIDAEASPVFFTDAQLLAVAYTAQAIRSALFMLVQSGQHVTWPIVETLILLSEAQVLEMAKGANAGL